MGKSLQHEMEDSVRSRSMFLSTGVSLDLKWSNDLGHLVKRVKLQPLTRRSHEQSNQTSFF